MGTPKLASTMAGVFGSITATVSPVPTPSLIRPEARRRVRA